MKRASQQQWMSGLAIALLWCFGCDSKDKAKSSAPAPTSPTQPVASPKPTATAAPPAAQETTTPPKADEEEAEPETIAAQHVLIAYRGAKRAPRGVTRTKAQAKKLAEEIVAKARKKPTDSAFAALAREYSDDEGTKNNLGNLGKFPKSKMVESFSEPAFKLKVGEISDAVETPFGFHIIKRNQ